MARDVQGISILLILAVLGTQGADARDIDLTKAVIVVTAGPHSQTEDAAATMLQQEVQRRTGLKWKISAERLSRRPVIALAEATKNELAGLKIPRRNGEDLPELRREGYRICVERSEGGGSVVWVIGADARGVLFGVGRFLRLLNWKPGRASLSATVDVSTSPAYPIRGHQLGYRARANSYDAWNASTYEQYIRDLILFGCNGIENIPFEDDQRSPHMTVPRDEMNKLLSEICDRYDLD